MASDVGTIGPSPGQGARSHVLRFGPGHVFPFLHVRVWTPCPHVTLHSPHSDQPVSVSVMVAAPGGSFTVRWDVCKKVSYVYHS
jgi:hypothetical protein